MMQARRVLPVAPAVHAVLNERRVARGQPAEGWVFPSRAKPLRRRQREDLDDKSLKPFARVARITKPSISLMRRRSEVCLGRALHP